VDSAIRDAGDLSLRDQSLERDSQAPHRVGIDGEQLPVWWHGTSEDCSGNPMHHANLDEDTTTAREPRELIPLRRGRLGLGL
jgi:hypothetical protein